jgi:acetyl/propionyl-CoA carboxylase alpha subunit
MTQEFPFKTVLVANRGEIAVRILKTVKRLGLRGVIVQHAADAGSLASRHADAVKEITGPSPVAAYLDGDQIIAAAKELGADAIHPGYGFLSENAGFARKVAAAGITFVGPTPEAIELMGDKVTARNFVEKHGFPVAPSAIEDDDPKTFLERARKVGAPLLIKPAAGGGGKGMRIVRDLALLDEEVERARSEGQRYFGDGRLYVERYVERPRHIEVQILGDAHGNVIHVWERECSIQRRFQKVIEESPSPALAPDERKRICEVAAGIARAANYRNAGTVEFIYGAGEFYFLEMNTRLQVEHPVTEEITGFDLVEKQLKIAAGQKLDVTQEQVPSQGHAIELRIYAEDASRGFTPTTGKIRVLSVPTGEGVRIDTGISEGSTVTSAFDPMIAKLVVRGKDRAEAIERGIQALSDYVLLGFRTNISFLKRLLQDADVRKGDMHTGLIGEKPELSADPALSDETRRQLLGTAAVSLRPVRDAAENVPALHSSIGAWRN